MFRGRGQFGFISERHREVTGERKKSGIAPAQANQAAIEYPVLLLGYNWDSRLLTSWDSSPSFDASSCR